MDSQQFAKACQLRDEGKLREAIVEFCKIAKDSEDAVDKAGVFLNVATTLKALGEYDQARQNLSVARRLAASIAVASIKDPKDNRLQELEVSLDFDEADILSFEGHLSEALSKFDSILKNHKERLRKPEFREPYEMVQSRRGFLLADLGRWREALPILEEAASFENRKSEIYFYMGHCYVSGGDHSRGAEKLNQALRLGLPPTLEFRAHCELGIAYFALREYAKAKVEFEKCASSADPEYINQAQIWRRLENTCRLLGLKEDADRYAITARTC